MTRYFHKVTQTEWVPALHGDPGGDPDVVELPPESTFWGEPMEPDEVMTFDGAGLPLARVPRTISPEEEVTTLMLAAGLTQTAMDRALYLAQRGDGVPLADFNAAMDALVLSESVTLSYLVGLL